MKNQGAIGLQNGVWVLPSAPEHEQFMKELVDYANQNQGTGQLFVAETVKGLSQEEIIDLFNSDRDEEYSEVIERCQDFLTELEKETNKSKFTFAELEDTEEDLQKLINWMEKIYARDFFKSQKRNVAEEKLELCQAAHQEFVAKVYAVQGIDDTSNSVD